MDFYDDTKWCTRCRKYVRYMRSLDTCHCVHCDRRVRLFSRRDLRAFHRSSTPVA